jgi:hypothetical protein
VDKKQRLILWKNHKDVCIFGVKIVHGQIYPACIGALSKHNFHT